MHWRSQFLFFSSKPHFQRSLNKEKVTKVISLCRDSWKSTKYIDSPLFRWLTNRQFVSDSTTFIHIDKFHKQQSHSHFLTLPLGYLFPSRVATAWPSTLNDIPTVIIVGLSRTNRPNAVKPIGWLVSRFRNTLSWGKKKDKNFRLKTLACVQRYRLLSVKHPSQLNQIS